MQKGKNQKVKYPYPVISYSPVYKNVSGQSLMLDNSSVASGSSWWMLEKDRYLTQEQYNSRGTLTNNLIEHGYIKPVEIYPVIPNGYLYMQSWEPVVENGITTYPWFRVWSVEKKEEGDIVGLSWDLERVGEPDSKWIINYSLSIPAHIPLVMSLVNKIPSDGSELNSVYGKLSKEFLATQVDFTFGRESMYHYKMNPTSEYLEISIPLAIPRESLLLIKGPVLSTKGNVFLTTPSITSFVKIAPSPEGVIFSESVSFEVDRIMNNP